jgi:ribosome-associated heat shock protein Hsp15
VTDHTSVRLDRWLWAARFFKTRGLAKSAIEGGKVGFHVLKATAQASEASATSQSIKPKVSKEVSIGDLLSVRRGWTTETVWVRGLSAQRGDATSARALYEETTVSIEQRETEVARRRMERAGLTLPQSRPSKRDRRQIKALKGES